MIPSRVRRGGLVLATLALLLAAGSCGAGDARSGEGAPLPRWSAESGLRVGSVDDPETTLTFFSDLEVGADGRMYLLHSQEQLVRVTASEGGTGSSSTPRAKPSRVSRSRRRSA